jgi:hypothetical protein
VTKVAAVDANICVCASRCFVHIFIFIFIYIYIEYIYVCVCPGVFACSVNGSGDPASQAVRDLFAQLLERHGHRCIKEAEMRTKEWRHEPAPLVKLLQALVKAAIAKSDQVSSIRVHLFK